MLYRFSPGNTAAERRMDLSCGLAQKEAAQLDGILCALIAVAADTGVHDPVGAGLVDEMLHNLGGQYNLLRNFDRLVHGQYTVRRKIEQLVAAKEPAVKDVSQYRYLGRPCCKKPAGKSSSH
jgi:hypothetical protein